LLCEKKMAASTLSDPLYQYYLLRDDSSSDDELFEQALDFIGQSGQKRKRIQGFVQTALQYDDEEVSEHNLHSVFVSLD